MNYINSTFTWIGQVFAGDATRHNHEKTDIHNLVNEVAKRVLVGVLPRAIAIAPFCLSRATSISVFSNLFWLCGFSFMGTETISLLYEVALKTFQSIKKGDAQFCGAEWTQFALSLVAFGSYSMAYIDLAGINDEDPDAYTLEKRVLQDTFQLFATAVSGCNALYTGGYKILSLHKDEKKNTASKVSEFVSGSFLIVSGACAMSYSIDMSCRLVEGVNRFQTLDPGQQRGVLRHRALFSLNDEKPCKAVIFEKIMTFPFAVELYKNCETLSYYNIENPYQFCELVADAKKHFNSTIDIFSFQGHANPSTQNIGYNFFGGEREMSCLRSVLSPNSQVFMLGCETAGDGGFKRNLAAKVAMALPDSTIWGVSTMYYPALTMTSVSADGRVHHSHFEILNGKTVNSVVRLFHGD